MREGGLARRLTAEALGTGILAATVIGSGIMAEQLAGGNQGLALLANSLATGAMLVVIILIFGPVSGAHFNPAVSLAFVLRGELQVRDAGFYAMAQIGGGLVGAIIAHVMFNMDLVQTATHVRTGPGQWVGEAVATGMLVLAIFACLRHAPQQVPVAVGLVITSNYWATSSTSFANPAITIARTITDTFTAIRPEDAVVFIIVQIAAAAITAAGFSWLFAEKAPVRKPAE